VNNQTLPDTTREQYRYAIEGGRAFKASDQPTKVNTQRHKVCYLPGLENRTTDYGNLRNQALRVITVTGGRILSWQQGKPAGADSHQVYFTVRDSGSSVTLELDRQGKTISREVFYPFGGSAVWAAQHQTQADYKFIRYGGKERDRTGLIYYGFRYYAPWLRRWINTDPSGMIDGPNVYFFVANNPLTCHDPDGRVLASRTYFTDETAHYTSLASRMAATLGDVKDNPFLNTLKTKSGKEEGHFLLDALKENNPQAISAIRVFHEKTNAGNLSGEINNQQAKGFFLNSLTTLQTINTNKNFHKIKSILNKPNQPAVKFDNISTAIIELDKINITQSSASTEMYEIVRTVTTQNILTATLEGKGKQPVLTNYMSLSGITNATHANQPVGNVTFITNGISSLNRTFFPIMLQSKGAANAGARTHDTEIKLLNAIRDTVENDTGPYTLTIQSIYQPCASCVATIASYTNNLNRQVTKHTHLTVNMSSVQYLRGNIRSATKK
jgi:RHS repeat-associated protein